MSDIKESKPRITDQHAQDVCKVGMGVFCCRYLSMGPQGWSCQKHGSLRAHLDQRVATETMHARGDNCEGRAE